MATGSFGGYDAEFVEPLSPHLECPVCTLALREPTILSCCGIKICQTCIEQIKFGGKGCPICREQQFTTMLEKQLCRLILDLKVRCSNTNNGCVWLGELRALQKHVSSECEYLEVPCQYECGRVFQRHLLRLHEMEECPK